MPDTITEFAVFTPATKARSGQVNTNFSNYRGTILPINEDTASSSHLSHDLGSTSHRWRTAFAQEVNLLSSTTTASLTISGDTSNTTGCFKFKIGGVNKAELKTDGFTGESLVPSSRQMTAVTITASGSWTIPSGVTTIFAWGAGGGGGGGGGGAANGGIDDGGGGGAGGNGVLPTLMIIPVTAGDVLSITVGAGGSAGSAGTGGANGGTGGTGGSTIIAYRGNQYTWKGATGGGGGTAGNDGTAAGGSAGDFTVRGYGIFVPGGAGGVGQPGAGDDGSPGSASGYFNIVTPSGGASPSLGGGGGGGANGYSGGGAGGSGAILEANGAAGSVASGFSGGGGGGGGASGNSNRSGGAGGAGGPGILIIHYQRI